MKDQEVTDSERERMRSEATIERLRKRVITEQGSTNALVQELEEARQRELSPDGTSYSADVRAYENCV